MNNFVVLCSCTVLTTTCIFFVLVNSPHNGVYKGKRYFHCPRGHGAFVHYHQVVRINPPEKRPPVRGNTMYPAYHDLRQKRKQRCEM